VRRNGSSKTELGIWEQTLQEGSHLPEAGREKEALKKIQDARVIGKLVKQTKRKEVMENYQEG